MPVDPEELGRELARLRLARGLRQKEVSDRIPTYYSKADTYGRVERGERRPERDALIAILAKGFIITAEDEINRVLALAEFEALTTEEIERFHLERAARPPQFAPEKERERFRRSGNNKRRWLVLNILGGSLGAVGLIAFLLPGHVLAAVLTSVFYAVLFVESIYLECAFEPNRIEGHYTAVALTFGAAATSSVAALAADRILVDAGSFLALPISLGIFVVAAAAQFIIARPALSEAPIVPATFQTSTAQGAHLKNTVYFLLIVLLFWLPSFHAVATLSREAQSGQVAWVRQMVQGDFLSGRGMLALGPRPLIGLLVAMLPLSLYMGHRLLDNLKFHPQLNSYTLLFYLRAVLYFLLSAGCIGWFAFMLSDFI